MCKYPFKGGWRRLFEILERNLGSHMLWIPASWFTWKCHRHVFHAADFWNSSKQLHVLISSLSRDVSAAVRDAGLRFKSALLTAFVYVITHTESVTKGIVREPDLLWKLLLQNSKFSPGSAFSHTTLKSPSYCLGFPCRHRADIITVKKWGSTIFFTQLNEGIDNLIRNGLIQRNIVYKINSQKYRT